MSKTQRQETCTVNSIVLLLFLIGHNMVWIKDFEFFGKFWWLAEFVVFFLILIITNVLKSIQSRSRSRGSQPKIDWWSCIVSHRVIQETCHSRSCSTKKRRNWNFQISSTKKKKNIEHHKLVPSTFSSVVKQLDFCLILDQPQSKLVLCLITLIT